MTVKVTKQEINVRERLAELANPVRYTQQQFWFEGDGSTTTFTPPSGWSPLHVYMGGLLQKEGSADEYTVSGTSVVFAVAPSSDVCIVGVM